uniref:Tungstate/molybdate transport system ATP-binding protein n=1 Tax=Solibacter usitatus (strain Ellin6076) TaxID=234267 RepID=Q01VD4_SOLUE
MADPVEQLVCDCRKRLSSRFELDARVSIPLTGVTVLFGASGSGKTTLLRLLAGLEKPDTGTILFRGKAWQALPPQQRRTGFLFQDYALFPHLTVAENVGYAGSRAAAEGLMEAFGLAEFSDRRPRAISGGQQQRTALARALAAGPELLLLDEPLSALDAPTRMRMRYELRRLLLAGGVPSIVVTHDRMEAVALGDWMAVMVEGRIRQSGPVREVFRRPADLQVAESVGVENVLPADVVGHEAGLLTLRVGEARLQCVDSGESGQVYACIHAEDVAITREAGVSSARNRLTGQVRSATVEGALARIELDCGFPLVAMVTAQSAGELALREGEQVAAVVKATAVHLAAYSQPSPR